MDEARVGPDELGQVREEGDDVVLGLALDLVDARDVELGAAALLPDRLGGLFRDDAELGHRVGGMRLDLEPDAKARLGRPDGGHLGAGIARESSGAGAFCLFLRPGSIGTQSRESSRPASEPRVRQRGENPPPHAR